jgi:hypothetical protein
VQCLLRRKNIPSICHTACVSLTSDQELKHHVCELWLRLCPWNESHAIWSHFLFIARVCFFFVALGSCVNIL